MNRLKYLKSALAGGASIFALSFPAVADEFNIPRGDLSKALDAYTQQAGVEIIYSDDAVRGRRTQGVRGNYNQLAALTQVLRGTGFTAKTMPSNAIGIVAETPTKVAQTERRAAQAPAAAAPAAIETVVVTAQKKSENVQTVPIAITALSQQELTEHQIAGGPDLLHDVPNMNFGKTNFSGYNLEIRGIGTQAISVTTDPAVAVAFNDTPFIRNHFFEQEFYDLADVEVLRGPQGTLYGRNATAGVVNLKSALPTDQYEGMLSADMGNYGSQRFEGMLNLPIVGDKLDIRFAGELTKRDGYTFDSTTGTNVDGRDLWSGRMTIGWKPISDLQTYLVWDHFSEDDDRLRSGKQLCTTAPTPTSVGGVSVPQNGEVLGSFGGYLSQGCQAGSLYSPSAFGTPNGYSLPYYLIGQFAGLLTNVNPYSSATQSSNLRVIASQILPTYRAKNDTLEFNATYNINSALTLTSQTGYNNDYLRSTEDYNRFASSPGVFVAGQGDPISPKGVFCDPQLGCSTNLLAEDLDVEHSWQASQEFRLASNFGGPFNFSFGVNYLHYETEENYYVFANTLTAFAWSETGVAPWYPFPRPPWTPGVSDNSQCQFSVGAQYANHRYRNPSLGGGEPELNACVYIDPSPIGSLNNQGHNYFLSQNPYVLNSYATFGEAYYNLRKDLKFTAGLRLTDDQKHFVDVPSELENDGWGYPTSGVVNQHWLEPTGRAVLDWTPNLDFTDQTLVYGSVSHGYKAGGANPPGPVLPQFATGDANPIHPLTFKPEYIEAFELGTKNSLLDGSLTLNSDIFYYNYTGYQISEIVDRSSINDNYNAHVEGAELESTWEPLPALRFNFAGGYENARLAGGSQGIDLMDRADLANHPGWMVVRPFPTQPSNCILPTYVVTALLEQNAFSSSNESNSNPVIACSHAYTQGLDPVTQLPYVPNPTITNSTGGLSIPAGYIGFNPLTAPNNGEGFMKNLSHNLLPNAPPFTLSAGGQYTTQIAADWAATFRADFYWQGNTEARVFNDKPYDSIHGYTNLNLTLTLASDDGWQVMGYIKNVFAVTAITGDFLNSDDSNLTTNVFLTDPRLFGVRVTKDFGSGDARDSDRGWIDNQIDDYFADVLDYLTDKDGGRPPLWIELGGQLEQMTGQGATFAPPFLVSQPRPDFETESPLKIEEPGKFSFGGEGSISFEPNDSNWIFSASIRFGRSSTDKRLYQQTPGIKTVQGVKDSGAPVRFDESEVASSESHIIADFMARKDVGFGMFGSGGSSDIGVGVRFAQFASQSNVQFHSNPDFHMSRTTTPKYKVTDIHHSYAASMRGAHSFRGVGPSISWNGSAPFAGNRQDGEIAFDWGANAAALFGRQRAKGHHQTTASLFQKTSAGFWTPGVPVQLYQNSATFDRNRTVVVPNVGGFAGLSMRYANAKVSFGYRADYFIGAMDNGIDASRRQNVGFFGPFANLSIGIGG
jgi:outer membrane receptor protein involved in Fe transport